MTTPPTPSTAPRRGRVPATDILAGPLATTQRYLQPSYLDTRIGYNYPGEPNFWRHDAQQSPDWTYVSDVSPPQLRGGWIYLHTELRYIHVLYRTHLKYPREGWYVSEIPTILCIPLTNWEGGWPELPWEITDSAHTWVPEQPAWTAKHVFHLADSSADVIALGMAGGSTWREDDGPGWDGANWSWLIVQPWDGY